LTLLLNKGIARQRVYELVQESALKSWKEKKSFRDLIFNNDEIGKLCTKKELESVFSKENLLKGIDKIYMRFENEK
jgi:adenylosuccinate lyase